MNLTCHFHSFDSSLLSAHCSSKNCCCLFFVCDLAFFVLRFFLSFLPRESTLVIQSSFCSATILLLTQCAQASLGCINKFWKKILKSEIKLNNFFSSFSCISFFLWFCGCFFHFLHFVYLQHFILKFYGIEW